MEYTLHRYIMAKGWRRFLQEESEHQWLAISVFFIFIIIGAFAIHGTSKLTGMDITFVTSASTDNEAKSLLSLIGLPFKKKKHG